MPGNLPLWPEKESATVYTDGASSGNPGPAGIGVLIISGDRRVTISEYIGEATNNVAEYRALIRALEEAQRMGITKVRILLDSELLVKQLAGRYRVRSKHLLPLHNRVLSLLKGFDSYEVFHIPRQDNTQTDALARKAIRDALRRRPNP